MKRCILIIVCVLVSLLLTACAQQAPIKPNEEIIIAADDLSPDDGADSYNRAGDNLNSKYFKAPDFYNLKSDKTLTIISKFKTFQQTSEWSCGPAAALTVLYHFGIENYTERELAVLMNTSVDSDVPDSEPGSALHFPDFGTNVVGMTDLFEGADGVSVLETSYIENPSNRDLLTADGSISESDAGNLPGRFVIHSLYATENDPQTEQWAENARDSYFVKWLVEHLEAGNCVLVEWAEWDGHWVVIIGYDDNGTPQVDDDVLIFADPYDTADHYQDGYSVFPLVQWFINWNDRNYAPKPYQLQPYVVVGK